MMHKDPSPFASHFYLSDLVHLLRRFWLPLLSVPLLVALAVGLYALFGAKYYDATASVYMDPSFGQRIQTESSAREPSMRGDEEALFSMEETMCSGPMILRVLRKLELDRDPTFLPSGFTAMMEKGEAFSDAMLIDAVKSRYEAELINATRILKVHVKDSEPNRAALIAETFVSEFVRFLQDQKVESEVALKESLLEQAEEIERRAIQAEEKLNEFRSAQPDFLVEQDSNLFSQQMQGVASELSQTNASIIRQESLLQSLSAVNASKNPLQVFALARYDSGVSPDGLIAQRSDALARLEEIKQRFNPSHPEYLAGLHRLESLDRTLTSHAEEAKRSAALKLEQLTQQRLTLEAEMAALRESFTAYKAAGAEFRGLSGKVEREWAAFERINQRILNLTDDAELSPNLATPLGNPIVPYKPSKKNVVSAAAAGMVVSVGWIVLVTGFLIFRGLPFTSTRQVQDILGVPLIATLREGEGTPDGSFSSLPMLVNSRRIVYLTAPDPQDSSSHVCRMVADAFLSKGRKVTVFRVTDNTFKGSHLFEDSQLETVEISSSTTDFVTLKTNIEAFLQQNPMQNVLIDTTAVTDLETKLALGRIADSALVIVNENGTTREQVEKWFLRLKAQMKDVLALYQSKTQLHSDVPFALPIEQFSRFTRPSAT